MRMSSTRVALIVTVVAAIANFADVNSLWARQEPSTYSAGETGVERTIPSQSQTPQEPRRPWWSQRPRRGLRSLFSRGNNEPAARIPEVASNRSDPRPPAPSQSRVAPEVLSPAPTVKVVPNPILQPPRATTARDSGVRRTNNQIQRGPGSQPPILDLGPPATPSNLPVANTAAMGAQSISLQAALYGAVTGNPDLISLRQGNEASAEAVEAAKHFPTTLNPTLWVDYRPLNFVPPDTFGGGTRGGALPRQHGYHYAKNYIYLSWRQPIELKHQTTHRAAIAQAAYDQQQWTVVTAEMTALVQTYRFYQTAAYRREKLRVAKGLADFNEKLLPTLRRRLDAGQVLPADLALAEVENQATRQQYEAAKQDYASALTDLQNQIGVPETAGTIEPHDPFSIPQYIPNLSEEQLIQTALASRPEIFAARANVAGATAAAKLADADRTPSPVIGPEYESDEVLVQYVGFVFVCPIPILNNGTPLLRQRQAELRRAIVAQRQIEQRTIAQVKAALAKWHQANSLVQRTSGLTKSLKSQVESIERLFDAGQADVTKLYQARQRLIQLENAELDAFWQATQSQSDLLLALGAPTLIASLQEHMEHSVAPGAMPTPPSAPNTPMPAPAPPTGTTPFQTKTAAAGPSR